LSTINLTEFAGLFGITYGNLLFEEMAQGNGHAFDDSRKVNPFPKVHLLIGNHYGSVGQALHGSQPILIL
jgi:hypothetical protein